MKPRAQDVRPGRRRRPITSALVCHQSHHNGVTVQRREHRESGHRTVYVDSFAKPHGGAEGSRRGPSLSCSLLSSLSRARDLRSGWETVYYR